MTDVTATEGDVRVCRWECSDGPLMAIQVADLQPQYMTIEQARELSAALRLAVDL